MTLTITLDDLVDAVSEFAQNDAEVVATVLHMLARRRVASVGDPGLTGDAAWTQGSTATRH